MPLPKLLPRAAEASGAAAVRAPRSAGSEDRVLAGRYRVGSKLGSGAFGCAYLVTDTGAGDERWAGRCACPGLHAWVWAGSIYIYTRECVGGGVAASLAPYSQAEGAEADLGLGAAAG